MMSRPPMMTTPTIPGCLSMSCPSITIPMQYFAPMKKLVAALFFLPSLVIAQPVAIKAARMFDGTSDALVQNAVVVVDGRKIVAAGPNASIPANARVIDLGDVTLLPGFTDAHVQ